MEIAVTTNPETISRKDVAALIERSVDYVDGAVQANDLDYAVLSGSNKPVVKNGKYEQFLEDNKVK